MRHPGLARARRRPLVDVRGIAERQWPVARFCLAVPGARDSDGRVLVRLASERLARRRKEKRKRQRRGFICPRSPRGGGEWLTWTTSPAATPRSPTTEALLRAGHPDLQGLLLALSDWAHEKRLIEEAMRRRELTK